MINKKVRKAVIPAAGLGTRFLPATKAQPKEMLPIVDKPTIQYIVEEAVASGIEEIIVITSSTKRSIEDHFDKSYELEDTLEKKGKEELLKTVKEISNMVNIHYIRQKEPLGLGHAVLCAKSFIGDEPFAVLLGDDIVYNGKGVEPALKQLINTYDKTSASVVGVQTVEKSEVDKYGIVEPYKQQLDENDYKVKNLIEKPSIEEAPSQLAILGRYVLTPEIFEFLETQERGAGNEIQLTDAIKRLTLRQAVYACDFKGIRYDVGDKSGFIKAQIDYSLRNESISSKVKEYLMSLSDNNVNKKENKIVFKIYLLMTLVSLILTYCVKVISEKLHIFEKYNERRMSKKQKVRIGGIAFVLTFMAFLPLSSFVVSNSFIWILVGLWIVFIGGLIDDIFELTPLSKTFFDLSGALIVVIFGQLTINTIVLPFGLTINIPIILNTILPVIWIVAVINIMNLIDGLDGLASGVSIITLLTIGIVATIQGDLMMSGLAIPFAFSVLGFVPLNWYPSKIMMGDCGSRSIGYIIACISLIGFKNITFVSIIVPFLLLAIPILDTTLAIIRRKKENISFSTPDRNHLHHKLFNHFEQSQVKAVLSIYLITLMFSLCSIIYSFHKIYGIISISIVSSIVIYIFSKMKLITIFNKREDNGK